MAGLIGISKKKIRALKEKSGQKRMIARAISNGMIQLYFDEKDRVRLYYNGNELTEQGGFITLLLSEGIWRDSSSGSRPEIQKISSDRMRIVSTSSKGPLSYIWSIKISPEGTIAWGVDIEVKESIRIDTIATRIFLSNSYGGWISPLHRGKFPSSFDTRWQPMDFPKDKCNFIGCVSSKQEYPSLIFKISQGREPSFNISNTDAHLSSRVLELQFEGEKEMYAPGTYPYVRAVIQLYPDKKVLEDMFTA
ncbi:hypothetical protein ACFL5X_03565, partial [Candidatus Omnitrophota bacterium]